MKAWYSKVRDTELKDGSVRATYVVTFETDNAELKREVEKYLQGIMDRTDRKTEPQMEKHKCRRCLYYDISSDYYPCSECVDYSNYSGEIETEPTGYNLSPVEDEPTISKMEQVDEPSGYKTKPVEDEPQMERPWGMYIVDHPMYE